jgi:hypothetical protein
MRCQTSHPPIDHEEETCPLCRALWENLMLRTLASDLGTSMLEALERGATILQACEDTNGTRH